MPKLALAVNNLYHFKRIEPVLIAYNLFCFLTIFPFIACLSTFHCFFVVRIFHEFNCLTVRPSIRKYFNIKNFLIYGTTFKRYFFEYSTFITGRGSQGSLVEIDLEVETCNNGFLALLHLIGMVYSKKHSTGYETLSLLAPCLNLENCVCVWSQSYTY